jgi:hypothetical protein
MREVSKITVANLCRTQFLSGLQGYLLLNKHSTASLTCQKDLVINYKDPD